MRSVARWMILLTASLLTACLEPGETSHLPGYSGGAGEVIVIFPKQAWQGAAGDEIKASLGGIQYGLPQEEPYFNLIQIQEDNFSNMFRSHRNIFMAVISSEHPVPQLQVETSVWARDQLVVKATAANATAMQQLLKENAARILQLFLDKEIERQIKRNRKLAKNPLNKTFQEKHGFTMELQKDVYLAAEQENCVWLRLERSRNLGGYEHQISQGILIHYEDYTDTSAFNDQHILQVKDSITQALIPGDLPDSYMTTVYEPIEPNSRETKLNSQYAKEIRGLWRMENAFMGGPFISLTTYDEQRQRIVTAEGYVFAPQFNKREFLREIEAMIKSIRFAE